MLKSGQKENEFADPPDRRVDRLRLEGAPPHPMSPMSIAAENSKFDHSMLHSVCLGLPESLLADLPDHSGSAPSRRRPGHVGHLAATNGAAMTIAASLTECRAIDQDDADCADVLMRRRAIALCDLAEFESADLVTAATHAPNVLA